MKNHYETETEKKWMLNFLRRQDRDETFFLCLRRDRDKTCLQNSGWDRDKTKSLSVKFQNFVRVRESRYLLSRDRDSRPSLPKIAKRAWNALRCLPFVRFLSLIIQPWNMLVCVIFKMYLVPLRLHSYAQHLCLLLIWNLSSSIFTSTLLSCHGTLVGLWANLK